MVKRSYSKHQQRIINRYYENLDMIMLQKLQELVTELYLAEGEKARQKLWERVRKALVKLKIPADVIEGIMERGSVETLASHVEQWLKKK